jgi:hypothetical protein
MLRPLAIGVPLILLVVAGFVAGMNLVPAASPYFGWVIAGYVVLFPLVLVWTIVATIRAVRRLIAGGDAALQVTGRRTRARVTAVSGRGTSVRMSGTSLMQLHDVTLRIDGSGAAGYDVKVVRPVPVWGQPPAVGDTVEVHVDPRRRDNLFVQWPDTPMPAEGALGMEAVPPAVRALLQKALGKMTEPKAALPQRGGRIPAPSFGKDDAPPPPVEPERPSDLEGRARIEGFRPWPDGTYDLDLHVTPRSRESYKIALRVAVPHERIEDLKRGLMLSVRIDPELASRLEIDWAKSRA